MVAVSGTSSVSTLMLSDIAGNSIATVTLPTSGNAQSIDGYQAFDEFGGRRGDTLDTGPTTYGWHGRDARATSDSGLILMGLRLYNPETGRFTSTDPISGAGENDYVFPNDPVNQSDNTGAHPAVVVVVFGIGLTLAQFLLLLLATVVAWLALYLLIQQIGKWLGQLGSWINGQLNSRSSDKEKKNDLPSWVKGAKINPGETIEEATKRTFTAAGKPIPPSNQRGPGSDWSKIKKYLTQRWNAARDLVKKKLGKK